MGDELELGSVGLIEFTKHDPPLLCCRDRLGWVRALFVHDFAGPNKHRGGDLLFHREIEQIAKPLAQLFVSEIFEIVSQRAEATRTVKDLGGQKNRVVVVNAVQPDVRSAVQRYHLAHDLDRRQICAKRGVDPFAQMDVRDELHGQPGVTGAVRRGGHAPYVPPRGRPGGP